MILKINAQLPKGSSHTLQSFKRSFPPNSQNNKQKKSLHPDADQIGLPNKLIDQKHI